MPNQQPNLEEQFNQTSQPAIQSPKPKFNLKYILIVLGLAILVGGGILAYQYWWLPKQETKTPEQVVLEFYQYYLSVQNEREYSTTSDIYYKKYSRYDAIRKCDNNDLEKNYKEWLLNEEIRLVDPILWASDIPPEDNLQVSSAIVGDNLASVDVTFLPIWTDHKLRISLLLVNNEWKISNVKDISEEIASIETANWQTYRNEELGFELKIPKNYSEFKSENLKSVWIKGPGDLSLFIDKSNNVNKGLLSLYDYINYIYKRDYYDNPNSGAYHNPKYADIMSSGDFINITSEDKNIEIWREKLTGALGGFESITYLMDKNNKTTMITFSWNVIGQDEKLAEKLLTQFNQILSTFKFIK